MFLKFENINHFLCKFPTALAGLALAIASLGFTCEKIVQVDGVIQLLTAIIAASIICCVYAKYLLNVKLLKQDLKHPIAGSLLPTLTMATMVVANSLSHYSLFWAELISVMAIFLHLCFLVLFAYYQSQNFKLKNLLPSWFIPPIGLAFAIVVYPTGLKQSLAELIFIFALLSYAVLLPMTLYRLFALEKPLENEKPLIIILATPASLLLLDYLIVFAQVNYLLVYTLLILAIVMTLFAYWKLLSLLRLPFTPAYSAFTFPLVVGASALFKLSEFLLQEGFNMQAVWVVEGFAYVELAIATVMVFYVSLRYLHHFSRGTKKPSVKC